MSWIPYHKNIERFIRFCSIQDLLSKIDQRFYPQHLSQSVKMKNM